MANRVEIVVTGKNDTDPAFKGVISNLQRIGSEAGKIGSSMSRNITQPLLRLGKELAKNDEMKAALEPIQGAFDEVELELVRALIPVIKELTPSIISLADSLKTVVGWFKELSPEQKEMIVGLLGLAVALGPVLSAFAFFIPLVAKAAPVISAVAAALTSVPGLVALAAVAVSLLGLTIGITLGNILTDLHKKYVPGIKVFFADIYQSAVTKFNEIVTKAGEFVSRLVATVREKIGAAWSVGWDFVQGLWNGINSKFSGLLADMRRKAGEIIGIFNSVFNLHSPSKVMEDIGRNMVAGLNNGLQSMSPSVAMSGMMAGGGVSVGGGSSFGPVVVNLTYSPAVSLASQREAQNVLLPYIRNGVNQVLARR